jgi:hypothetical protein
MGSELDVYSQGKPEDLTNLKRCVEEMVEVGKFEAHTAVHLIWMIYRVKLVEPRIDRIGCHVSYTDSNILKEKLGH